MANFEPRWFHVYRSKIYSTKLYNQDNEKRNGVNIKFKEYVELLLIVTFDSNICSLKSICWYCNIGSILFDNLNEDIKISDARLLMMMILSVLCQFNLDLFFHKKKLYQTFIQFLITRKMNVRLIV